MAEAAISSLLEVLGDVLIKEVKFLRGTEGKVISLRDELERMQSFLIDANKKQYEDARVRHWISEIRELAQDAEDTVEMFLINAANARCIIFPKCAQLHRIGEDIESIQEKLEAIKRSRDTYGIRDLGEAAASTQSSRVEWRRRQIDDRPVGLEDDVEKLLQESILEEKKRGLSVAVVEGMGGIGKSTLARKVYNHPRVVGGFECRAWVVVSSEFSPQETIKQIIFELSMSLKRKNELREEIMKLEESNKDMMYLQQKLQQMLYEELEANKYFIVLDDVWEVEHWEIFKTAFPYNQRGKNSRLLITTRNKGMAKCGQFAHKMKGLNPEKSWELLLSKTFVDGKCPQELESIGRQILEKCNGLPLAIRVVGGLLVGKHSKSEWEQVLYQINSHLGSADSYVSTILELSYLNLSPQLKSCFLCLAFFKEDAIILAERLVNIWVGQGLIRLEGRKTTEEIGGIYLDELTNRNIVQIRRLTFDDRVKQCQLHDLIRDVCLRKANEEISFSMVKEGRNTTSTEASSSRINLRHCVMYDEKSEFIELEHSKHLRSLYLVNFDRITLRSRYWKCFQLLKILDLEGFKLGKLPRFFRTLIGLKYLRIGITNNEKQLKIPRWLDHLKKLEVIDIVGSSLVRFPNVNLKMELLRYFRAGGFICGLHSLKNWKTIETLRDIWVDDWMRCSSKLMANSPLRELGIDLFSVRSELRRIQESLEKMENLVKLRLHFSFENPIGAELCIPQLASRLTRLKLNGPMKKCPDASKFPPNLSHLTLKWSKLNEDPMPELGKLSNLIYLKLHSDAYKGKMIKVLHGGFPCLKVLALIKINGLRGIKIEEGGMSDLKHLRIRGCSNLNTLNLPEHIIISTI